MHYIRVLIVTAIFVFALLFIRCGNDLGYPPRYRYWFGINTNPEPYHLDYSLHDTLWLNIFSTDKALFDTISGKTYLFDSMAFNSALHVTDVIDKSPVTPLQIASFVYPDNVVAATLMDDSSSTAEVTYGCPSPDYSLKLAIVFLRSGIFDISFINKHILDCPGIYNEALGATYYFNVNDTHLSFYKQLPWDSLGKQPDEREISRLQNKTSIVIHVQ